ncbi:MAG: penicillin-binding protein 1C [Verrucomicrobiota bacterium]
MRRRLTQLIIAGALCYGVTLYLVPLFFSLPEDLGKRPPQGLVFTDLEDRPVRRLLDGELRADEPATYGEFPKVLVNATLAAEDARFFSHNGIDYIGLGRAARDAALHGRFLSGASTVSQQTIKLYSPLRQRTFKTKAIEIFSARKLEMLKDKQTILTAYLNRLPYGNQFTGARAAARGYFGKPLGDLSLAEAALLAALPNKPTRLNPWRNYEGARKRQVWILRRMADVGYISEADFASALVEEIQLLPGVTQTFQAPHFVELVMKQEADHIKVVEEQGASVCTTLDLGLQRFVESTVVAELTRLSFQHREVNDLQAAVVVIENETGAVRGLTGSRSFFGSRSGQINGAWTPRSPGSTLKPFTYLLALEAGYHPASLLADTPIEYVTSSGSYQPVNFDRRFSGPVSLRHALANSLNVPAVKLLDQLGGPRTLHELIREELEFSTLSQTASEYGLGLTLGNAEVRLLELTNAYACLARLGEYRPYHLIERNPDTIEGSGSIQNQKGQVTHPTLFDPAATWLIADILSDRNARVAAFGLNSPLNFPFRVAAKTGTSTDFRDNWTIGYTPEFTVGVWVGRFNNRPLKGVSGAIGAAPIFHQIMSHLHLDREATWYARPDTIVAAEVDRITGLRIGAQSLPADRKRQDWFIDSQLPRMASRSDFDKQGRSLLPLTFAQWWHSDANHLDKKAALAPLPKTVEPQPFRIISPLSGTVAFLDPDLPSQGGKFPLEIEGHGREDIEWASDTLTVENDGTFNWLVLKPGLHAVIARDRKTGLEVTVHLTVEAL